MPGAGVVTGASVLPPHGRRPIRGTVDAASRRRGAVSSLSSRLVGARSAGRVGRSETAPPPASDADACVFERDDVALLPNGARMRYVSRPDVQFLYDEIFVDECYAKHGLAIREGATVIDVGGNIGMFALYAAEKAGAEGRVFALEPIPRTFAALRENVIRNVGFSSGRNLDATVDARGGEKEATSPSGTRRVACLDAKDAALALRRDEFQNHVGDSTREAVVAYNVGVSDGEKKEATFTFYPRAAGWSSLAPDDAETRENVRRFVERRLSLPSSTETLDDSLGASAATAALHPLATLGAKLLAFADDGDGDDDDGGGGGASRKQEEAFPRFRRRISDGLVRFARGLARLAFSLAVSAVTAYLLGGKTTSACPLVTVSDVIRANGLGGFGAATDETDEPEKPYAVDFLKIDVERNELATLRGIDRTHRGQIAQIAMEVHDDERNGLQTVIDLLTAPASGDGFGFLKTRVVAEQPDELKGGSLWNVYARR